MLGERQGREKILLSNERSNNLSVKSVAALMLDLLCCSNAILRNFHRILTECVRFLRGPGTPPYGGGRKWEGSQLRIRQL